MLMELLSKASTVAMLSFVVSSMLAMGAGLTVSQISEPLRNARLVTLALLANFVVMPLGALVLAKVLWLDEPFGVGLLLLGCAAGAPFLPKLAELAKGNLGFAVGAMVLLMVVTVVYLPIVLPLLLPEVSVELVGNCSLPHPSDAAPARHRPCLEGALWRLSRTLEAYPRLGFQPQPHLSRRLDHSGEHRQGVTSVRYQGNSCRAFVYRIGLWGWLVARWT